jgi:hypothetical protein
MSTNGSASLQARAQARREALLDRQTTIIEVPGYEGILAMEYRAMPYAEGRKINARHERQRDEATRELYVAADQLIAASVNAHELSDDGTTKPLEVGWGAPLARMLGVEVDDTTTVRQAMMACFARDTFLTRHWAEYIEWLSSAEGDADEEQRADFQVTG